MDVFQKFNDSENATLRNHGLPQTANKLIAEFTWGYKRCPECKKSHPASYYRSSAKLHSDLCYDCGFPAEAIWEEYQQLMICSYDDCVLYNDSYRLCCKKGLKIPLEFQMQVFSSAYTTRSAVEQYGSYHLYFYLRRMENFCFDYKIPPSVLHLEYLDWAIRTVGRYVPYTSKRSRKCYGL